jgi:hypothetical protein
MHAQKPVTRVTPRLELRAPDSARSAGREVYTPTRRRIGDSGGSL